MEKIFYSHTESFSEKFRDTGNRRNGERRVKRSKGFVHLSTIGWYCRRERNRRSDDSLLGFSTRP